MNLQSMLFLKNRKNPSKSVNFENFTSFDLLARFGKH